MRLTESYLHLSKDKGLHKLTPKIPHSVANPENDVNLENTTIKRTCLANTIDGCILGIGISDTLFNKSGSDTALFHCYQNTTSFLGLSNEEIIKRRYVFDAAITGEVWALEEISVVHLYDVLIHREVTKIIEYTPIIPTHLKEIPNKFLVNGKMTNFVRKWEVITN